MVCVVVGLLVTQGVFLLPGDMESEFGYEDHRSGCAVATRGVVSLRFGEHIPGSWHSHLTTGRS